MIYSYAVMEQSNGAPPRSITNLLQQVVAVQPDDADAEIFLANVETSERQYGAALSALARLHSVKPDQAYNFFTISAFCRANLHDADGARSSAKRALEYAKTPAERLQIDNLLNFVDQSSRASAVAAETHAGGKKEENETQPLENATSLEQRVPTRLQRDEGLPRVRAKTKAFECGHGTFRLRIQAGEREMVFAMNDLQNIVVRNVKELKWSCGPLPPQDVTVVYQHSTGSRLDGTVTELIF